ncbi:MAG: HAMP domain-containing protein, partial [bacterium]|nr:HAMP domain-containing protein [bacterium]
MKIRTQLIVALLLLAVVPLAGIVLYSYVSSRRAVRETVETEAAALTGEMERRLGAVKSDLRERMTRLGGVPFAEIAGDADTADDAEQVVVKRWLAELGDAATLIDSFEVIPEPPRAPLPPGTLPPRTLGFAPDAPPPGQSELSLSGPEPPTQAEIESIVLEVTREYEDLREHADPGDLDEEITLGIQMGADIATAMAEAFGHPPEAPEAGGLEYIIIEGEGEGEAPEGAAHERWQSWIRDLERDAEHQGRAEERLRRADERQTLIERRKRSELVLGPELAFPMRERGTAIGRVKPHLSAQKLLRRVFQQTRREQGELPFALDAEDRLYVAEEADRAILEDLQQRLDTGSAPLEDWVVVTKQDPETGLRFGIARPIRESLKAVEAAAKRSLTFGLSAILLALVGVVGLSTRMTRRVEVLNAGAERIAGGDLQTRVPVRGRDELGQLAGSFNRMAGELSRHQEKLLEQERKRRDQEIARQVLEADNERKTRELEEARDFQLSLLPKALPEHPSYHLAVHMETATEVGGDYYDFRSADDGTLISAVGDATGH